MLSGRQSASYKKQLDPNQQGRSHLPPQTDGFRRFSIENSQFAHWKILDDHFSSQHSGDRVTRQFWKRSSSCALWTARWIGTQCSAFGIRHPANKNISPLTSRAAATSPRAAAALNSHYDVRCLTGRGQGNFFKSTGSYDVVGCDVLRLACHWRCKPAAMLRGWEGAPVDRPQHFHCPSEDTRESSVTQFSDYSRVRLLRICA